MTLKSDYQCVLVGEIWHACQEQANPPKFLRGTFDGCWTICCKWGEFTRGFDKKRPTCEECLSHCIIDETNREAKKKKKEDDK